MADSADDPVLPQADQRAAHFSHQPMAPKHHHGARGPLKRKRQDYIQTALDLIVVDGSATVGAVLLGSIPSDPTTATLPGFGPLTLSSIPASTTSSSLPLTTPAVATAASQGTQSLSSLVMTTSGNSTVTSTVLRLNSTITSSFTSVTSSSIAYNVGVATSANATVLPTSSSSPFNLTSTSQSSSATSFTTTTTFASSSAASSSSAGGVLGGGAGAPTASSPGSSATAAAASTRNSNNDNAGPIAGGVVGGVAGAAVVALLLFLLLRLWRKRQARGQQLLGEGPDEETRSAPAITASPSTNMAQRSSLAPIAAAFGRFRPDSTQSNAASSAYTGNTGSERGFQRVGGRKLTSVLQSGGDGYVEPAAGSASLQPPPAADGSAGSKLSGTSFYRDSASHYGSEYGGTGQDAAAAAVATRHLSAAPSDSSVAAADPLSNRGSIIYESPSTGNPFIPPNPRAERALPTFSTSPGSDSSDGIRSPTPDANETLTVRQGPLRTPIITGGSNTPSAPSPRRPGRGPDGLGRSRPSWDGSRHSRFSEAI